VGKVKSIALFICLLAFALPWPAWADTLDARPVGMADSVYSASLNALTVLFVTAVLLESAFATIFNWRVFLTYFNERGIKTIIMVIVSLIVVWVFKLDVMASLIAAYKLPAGSLQGNDAALALAAEFTKTSGPVSTFVTALILAGGSAGVNNVMMALGFRSNRAAEVAPAPPQDEAWVAIKVKKRNADGQVHVIVSKVDAWPAGKEMPPAIAGTIGFSRPRVSELLFRNIDRFPQNGGYVVKPNTPYRLTVEGKDAAGNVIRRLNEDDRYYAFAPRAIVDFQVEV
jgi:hypothetical protein